MDKDKGNFYDRLNEYLFENCLSNSEKTRYAFYEKWDLSNGKQIKADEAKGIYYNFTNEVIRKIDELKTKDNSELIEKIKLLVSPDSKFHNPKEQKKKAKIKVVIGLDGDGHFRIAPLTNRDEVMVVLKSIHDGDYLANADEIPEDYHSLSDKAWEDLVGCLIQRGTMEIKEQ